MKFGELNQRVIEKLGTPLPMDKKQTISDLNEIPQELIENAKKLSDSYLAQRYLEFYVTLDNKEYLRNFVHSIITRDRQDNVSTWKKGSALIVDSSLEEQLTIEKEALFKYGILEFKHIVKPKYSSWIVGSHHTGMFTFLKPDSNYKSTSKDGYLTIPINKNEFIEVKEKDIDMMYRRWIASRMSGYLNSKNKLKTFKSAKVLQSVAPEQNWTTDAKKAFEGLLKERENYTWKENDIPGFCGLDSYYE